MAYDLSYEWAQPPRWRRWVARAAAVAALAGCGVGLYEIVHDGTASTGTVAASLEPQVRAVAASSRALERRLVALRPSSDPARALRAVQEAQGDRVAAADTLREARTHGPVIDDSLLAAALSAHRAYLAGLAAVLRHPGRRLAGAGLGERARRAKAAWGALADPAGLPRHIRGYGHVEALARHRRHH